MHSKDRILELDVLRGVAILLVMGLHWPAYPIWSTVGHCGVDLFFVLSGFLISNLLFTEYRRTGNVQLRRFFFRRMLKLYPSFYFMLAISVPYALCMKYALSSKMFWAEFTMTQNYIGTSMWGHTWSLCVEEHFYILLPLLLAYLMRRNKGAENPFQSIPWIFAGLAVVCLAFRFIGAAEDPSNHRLHYAPSHMRFDSLFFGVFLSYLHNFRPAILQKLMSDPWRFPLSVLSLAGLLPGLLVDGSDPFYYTIGFTTLYLSFGTLLALALYQPKQRKAVDKPHGLVARTIARVGIYSYTLYLWNSPLVDVFDHVLKAHPSIGWYPMQAIWFCSSIAVAVLTAKLVEIPMLKLRDRIWAADTSKPAVQRPEAARTEHFTEMCLPARPL
jgi:peptidoglycan/LPS O-acetylase OafA/YrhL